MFSAQTFVDNNENKNLKIIRFKNKTYFLNNMHAKFILIYEYHYNNRYVKFLIDNLQFFNHSFEFIRLDDFDRKTNVQIIIIKLKKSNIFDHFRKKFRIAKNTILETHIRVENVDNFVQIDFQVAENSLTIDFESANVVTYVKRNFLFQNMFTKYSIMYFIFFRKFFFDTFTEKINNERYNRALNIIHELFDEINRKKQLDDDFIDNDNNFINKHDKWWYLTLNQWQNHKKIYIIKWINDYHLVDRFSFRRQLFQIATSTCSRNHHLSENYFNAYRTEIDFEKKLINFRLIAIFS